MFDNSRAFLRMGWTGRAPAPNGSEGPRGLEARGAHRHIPEDGCCNRPHHWHRYRQEHLHLIGLDDRGAIVLREKLTRGRIAARLANVPQCLIGIEAGMATHCVARELIALGHDVRQVPPPYARPFRQAHKNDFRDAYAIAEAVQRPSTRFVPVKTDDQLDLQALHRVRSRLISERTAAINQMRSFLLSAAFQSAKGFASFVSNFR